MSIIKKSSFPLHLDVFSVFINDTSPTSRYFKVTQLPDTLTGGKNAFLIQGSLELNDGSYLFVEIKDSNGQVIYSEPAGGAPSDYYEGVAKPVSIHVYDDTLFGPATITIVGELKEWDDNGIIRPIPDEWRGKINVKWQKTINVNPFLANTTPVRLYRRPKIEITETLLPIYERINTQQSYNGYFRAIAIDPADGTNYPYNGPIKYEIVSINPTSASFTVDPPIILNDIPATKFKADSINKIINTTNLQLQTGVSGSPFEWNPTITDLINPFRAIVNIPYVTDRSISGNSQIRNIAYGTWNSTYESSSITISDLSSSYAQINIKDLETFSGDIYRLKVFAKSRNDLKGYFLLEDIVLENNELLQTNFFEGDLNRKTGVFNTPTIIQNFWQTSSLQSSGSASFSQTDNLINAVLLEPAEEFDSSYGIFKFYNSSPIPFEKDFEYILKFTPLFSKSTFSNKGLLDVYMSGSSFNDTDNINAKGYGKKIVSLSGTDFKRFEPQSINFKADNVGTGSVSFIVRNGNWELSDVSLKSAKQTAFNPSELTFLTKPNIQIPSESFDFRFELFDINYTYVPITLEKTIRFGGGNDILPGITFTFNNDTIGIPGTPPPTFIISPTAVSASTTLFGITGTLNLVQAPLTFDSASATAYDTGGFVIEPSHVEDGYPYPGLLTNLIGNDISTPNGPVKATLTYENFISRIKPDINGRPRYVGRVDYEVYQTNNNTIPNPKAKFTINSDWSAFLGCAAPVIQNISQQDQSLLGVRFWTTASFVDYTNSDTEHLIYYKPAGSGSWFRATNPSGTTMIASSSMDSSSLFTSSSWGPDNPSNYYYQIPDARGFSSIDFRILKRCFGDGGIFAESDIFTVISSPFLEVLRGNAIISAPSTSPPPVFTIDGYNEGAIDQGEIEVFSFRAGNFTNSTGNLKVLLTGGGFDAFEMAISSSTPVWDADGNLDIPWTSFGSNIPNKLLVRLKNGRVSGNYSSTISVYPQSEPTYPFTQVVPISSTVTAGALLQVYVRKGRNTGADYRLVVDGDNKPVITDDTVSPSLAGTRTLYSSQLLPVGVPVTLDWVKQPPTNGSRAYYATYWWSLCSNIGPISYGSEGNPDYGINADVPSYIQSICLIPDTARLPVVITPTQPNEIITLEIAIDDMVCDSCLDTQTNPINCAGFPSTAVSYYQYIQYCI